MSEIGATPRELDIGRVLRRTFDVLARNFLAFGLAALVFYGAPYGADLYLPGHLPGEIAALGSFAMWFVLLATYAVAHGFIAFGTIRQLEGQTATPTESLAVAIRNILPLFGIGLVFSLTVAAGMIIFVVPGLMVGCAWCIATPVQVNERTGVFKALERSAELTRNNRWRIFGVVVAGVVAYFVAAAVLMTPFGGLLELYRQAPKDSVVLLGLVLVSTLSSVVAGTFFAVLYVELQEMRSGGSRLAQVFS